jgi:hypothetical protein
MNRQGADLDRQNLFCRNDSISAIPQRIRLASLSVLLFFLLTFFSSVSLQAGARLLPPTPKEPHQESAHDLVRDVVWNEVQAQLHDETHWRFHETQGRDAARKLYDVIQTQYGELHRLLAIGGNALKGRALQVENNRIQQLSENPAQMEAAQKRRDADAMQERTMLRMLPDAFLYHEEGQQGDIMKLSFAPNPDFNPSSREAEVFHHMEGTVLVDVEVKRLVQIDGRLMTRVNFWGGILGHLDQGGTFQVEQRDVGDGHWDMVFLNVNMNGKALFFKTISVQQHETYSDYHRVPDDLSPAQAARELKQDVESQRDLSGE